MTECIVRHVVRDCERDIPWVVLVRHSAFSTTAMYLERAMQKLCNVVSVYVDPFDLLYHLPRVLSARALRGYVKHLSNTDIHPDLVFVVDPVLKRLDLRIFKAPTAYYAIDSHISFERHFKHAGVEEFDYVFVAQKDYVPKYREGGCEKVCWLPLACDPDIHRRYELPLCYDIAFIGKAIPGTERELLVSQLQARYKMYAGRAYLHEMARIYSQSRIVFNKSIGGDLNMRVFEAMSCGRLLVTDSISNGLTELFVDGEHLVIYRSLNDLLTKVENYLSDEERREQIASKGADEVRRKHTYANRIEQIVNSTLR